MYNRYFLLKLIKKNYRIYLCKINSQRKLIVSATECILENNNYPIDKEELEDKL